MGVPYTFEETSLTGTELYHSMVKAKTKWTGMDDDWLDDSELPKDHAENIVTLESQRMRMFRLTLQPGKPAPRPPPSSE